MAIVHILNKADVFFMLVGLGVALLMMVMGGNDERRSSDRSTPDSAKRAVRVRRR
jgi:hypothetical protein